MTSAVVDTNIAVQSTQELDGQGVLILRTDALRDPEYDGGEHQSNILRNIRITVVGELFGVVMEDVLEYEYGLESAALVSIIFNFLNGPPRGGQDPQRSVAIWITTEEENSPHCPPTRLP